MSIRLAAAALISIAVAMVGSACLGGDEEPFTPRPTSVPQVAATPTPTPESWPTPAEPPAELKVAYINLLSPYSLDETNTVPAETLDERLAIIVEELKAYQPDIVGISEVTVDGDYHIAKYLAAELRMEAVFARSNPWPLGYTYDDAGQLAEQNGLVQEGEAILVRSSRYPLLAERTEIAPINPRPSTEERRAALHITVSGPEETGPIDVYIARLTSGDDLTHARQARDFLRFVERTRSGGPIIVMGDFAEAPETETYAALTDAGLLDLATVPGPEGLGEGTCCREAVLVEEPAEPLPAHTSYMFTAGSWLPDSASVFGAAPTQRADGTFLYGSDHNGLIAQFSISSLVAQDGLEVPPP